MSLTNDQLVKEAKEYQKFTEVAHEIHTRIIKIFSQVWVTHDDYLAMPYNYPALEDHIHSLIAENYRRIIYSVDVNQTSECRCEVTLNFTYDNCSRNFTLFDHDFRD